MSCWLVGLLCNNIRLMICTWFHCWVPIFDCHGRLYSRKYLCYQPPHKSLGSRGSKSPPWAERDIPDMSLCVSAREKAHPVWPLMRKSFGSLCLISLDLEECTSFSLMLFLCILCYQKSYSNCYWILYVFPE